MVKGCKGHAPLLRDLFRGTIGGGIYSLLRAIFRLGGREYGQ